jgi:hypothetical protein
VQTFHGAVVCLPGEGLAGQDSVWVACRPEGVLVTAARPQGENVFAGRITAVVFAGDQITYRIAIGEQAIHAKSDPFHTFQDGDQVFVQFPARRCLLLRRAES